MTAIAIIGGSGLYQLDEIENSHSETVSTPYGEPSDALTTGTLQGQSVHLSCPAWCSTYHPATPGQLPGKSLGPATQWCQHGHFSVCRWRYPGRYQTGNRHRSRPDY